MKKQMMLALIAVVGGGVAKAQFAGEYNLGNRDDDCKGYDRISLSYNNDSYGFNKDAKWYFEAEEAKTASMNGFGLNYVHGFSLSQSLPMFLEMGGNVNFNFGNMFSEEEEYRDVKYKFATKAQFIDLQVPVNYVYKINVGDDFSIAPYIGLNFKLNLVGKVKPVTEVWTDDDYEMEEDDWLSLYSKDDMDEIGTWNRFQMGWHIGAGFEYSKIYLGIQYGTDFIPAFSTSEDGYKPKVNTGSLKINIGYTF